jgi:hypothetical protein
MGGLRGEGEVEVENENEVENEGEGEAVIKRGAAPQLFVVRSSEYNMYKTGRRLRNSVRSGAQGTRLEEEKQGGGGDCHLAAPVAVPDRRAS